MQEANQEIYLHFKVFSSITLATATICCIGDWSRYDDADAGDDDVDNDFLSFSSTAPINTTSTSSIPSPRSSTTPSSTTSSTTSSTPTTPLTPSPTTPLTTSSTPSPTSTPS